MLGSLSLRQPAPRSRARADNQALCRTHGRAVLSRADQMALGRL